MKKISDYAIKANKTWYARKLFLKMKLTVFVTLFTFIQVLGTESYSQEMKLNLNIGNTSLKEILALIEDRSGYYFMYSSKMIDVERKIKDVHIEGKNILEALDEILKGTDIEYSVKGRQILLSNKYDKDYFPGNTGQQSRAVSGRVTDSSGAPLPGVTVVIKGTTQGTITDGDGNYSLPSVHGDGVLVFSFVGMRTQEVSVAGKTMVNVTMDEDAIGIEEVVAVGYGTQRKIDLTGSVGTVGANELSKKQLINASTALAGSIAGVSVNQNSGMAGDDNASINIRGLGTLNNSSPLIIIDGVIATTQDVPIKDAFGSTQFTSNNNPLNSINPNDIESISVLKDAASASIYGSRAANGVIIVTTKRGEKGEKAKVDYQYTYGVTKATSFPEMVTNSVDYMHLANEAAVNSGKAQIFSDEMINTYAGYGSITSTDWMAELFKKAPVQEHNLSISGGSAKSRYFTSLGYLDQDAVIKNSGFKRYNSRINLDTEVSKRIKIGTNVTFSRGEQITPSDNVYTVTVMDAMRSVPIMPSHTANGELAMPDFTAFEPNGSAQTSNAFARLEGNKINLIKQDFLFNSYFEYKIIEELTFRGEFTANINSLDRTGWQGIQRLVNWRYDELMATGDYDPNSDLLVSAPTSGGSLSKLHSESKRINPYFQLTYDKEFGVHKIYLMVGASQEKYIWDLFQTSRRTFASNTTQVLDAGSASTSQNSEQTTQNRMISQFGRLNYNYHDKFLFQANIRRDGSSRFSEKYRYGVFPSFSAGYVISNEDFFKNNVGFINYLKLRGSWGKLGNQYSSSDFPYKALISFSGNYNFGGSVVSGTRRTTFGNDNLKWEVTTTNDFGFNMNVLNSKLSLEGAYYTKKTEGILYNTPIPSTTGFTSTYTNLASVKNRGWELTLNYNDKIGNVNLSLGANIAYVKNELLYIDPEKDAKADVVVNGNYALLRGEPIDAIYGLKVIGIFQNENEVNNSPTQFSGTATGDLKFEDISGPNGTPDGVINAYDRQVLGHDSPSWIYGFNINLGYKNFELSSNFQGIGDAQSYGFFEYYSPTFQGSNFGKFWMDRWTPENPSATIPRVWDTSGPNTQITNSFFVQDRSYLRLKNLQLSYSLPESLMKSVNVSNARVFVNGQNLWTLTNFDGFDPEKTARNTRSGFPQLKMYSVGINLTF